jgi:hypothetical protein
MNTRFTRRDILKIIAAIFGAGIASACELVLITAKAKRAGLSVNASWQDSGSAFHKNLAARSLFAYPCTFIGSTHVSRRTTAFAGQTKEVTAQPQVIDTARSRARPYN